MYATMLCVCGSNTVVRKSCVCVCASTLRMTELCLTQLRATILYVTVIVLRDRVESDSVYYDTADDLV